MSVSQYFPAAAGSHLSAAAAAQYGTWLSYGGSARFWLAAALVVAAGGVAVLGARLRHPVRFPRRGRGVLITLLVSWVLAIVALAGGAAGYVEQLRREHLAQAAPADPITPVTVIGVGVILLIVAVTSPHEWRTTFASAAIGAMAAPMIFELPFDLIVMTRTYPPVPPDPAAYRALFFAPLFLIEVTTLALLTLSPMVRLSRATFFSVATMLAIFAIWALLGFAYPGTPGPLTLNVLSKIAAFAATLSLFLPVRARHPAPPSDPDALPLTTTSTSRA